MKDEEKFLGEAEEARAIEKSEDEKIDETARRILEKYKKAFEELAK